MVINLQANVAQRLQHFPDWRLVYIKQYGPGNLRLATNPDDLLNTIGSGTQDGIVISTASGWQQFFWNGELWLMSDQIGVVVSQFPGGQPFISPGFGSRPMLPNDPNLSTYKGR